MGEGGEVQKGQIVVALFGGSAEAAMFEFLAGKEDDILSGPLKAMQ